MRVRSGDVGGGISSKRLKGRVWFLGETDSAACEWGCSRERGEDKLCCI